MTKNRLRILYLTAVVTLTATTVMSCLQNTVFNEYRSTHISGWDKTQLLEYDIPPIDIRGNYLETVGIRFTNDYPFTTLSLIVKQETFPSKTTVVDTLNCKFIDEKGNTKGHGLHLSQTDTLFRVLPLNTGDSIHVTIRHNMRRDVLPGISDIGFKLDIK